jgi:D-glycero-D-manno-heptose 1,7-bisphosphate phosphatase
MNKVVFLDRDGVVNVERGDYTWKIEDFKLTIGLVSFLKAIFKKGYLAIIISNQGGIGKGVCTKEDVEKAHQYLKDELAKGDLFLTDIYYCPHHPNAGKCLCRKPEPLLLEKAIARYQVDVTGSYFIGDTQRDMEAGAKVGIKTILVGPNEDLNHYLHLIENL